MDDRQRGLRTGVPVLYVGVRRAVRIVGGWLGGCRLFARGGVGSVDRWLVALHSVPPKIGNGCDGGDVRKPL
jgi:hypothetical protein